MGRPSSYDPAYCETVLELGNQGASVVEMAYEIGVCRATLEANWPAEHPEFLEAFTRAKEASQVWWERKGRGALDTPGFQSSVWSRSMAARFPHDWRETKRNELTGKDGDAIETRELNEDAAAFRRRLLQRAATTGTGPDASGAEPEGSS